MPKRKAGSHLKPRDAAGMAELRKLANTPAAKAKSAATRKRNAAMRRAAKEAGTTMILPGAERAKLAAAIGVPTSMIGEAMATPEGKKARKAVGKAIAKHVEEEVVKKEKAKTKRAKKSTRKARKPKHGIVAKRAAAKRRAKAKKATTRRKPKAHKKAHAKKATPKKHKTSHKGHKHAAKKTTRKGHRKSTMVKGHPSGRKLTGHGRKCVHCGGPHTARQHWSHYAQPGKFNYRRATKSGKAHKGRSSVGLLGYIFG